MPLEEHPDHAIASAEPDTDQTWMDAVLSPSVANAPSSSATPFSLDDSSALAIETDIPASSLRLQFLRAWIAARGGRPDEAHGHA